MNKRYGSTKLADNSGSVQVESINMEMFTVDVATHPRDREWENRIGGTVNIELSSNKKVVDFHIAGKPIRSELYRYSTKRTLDIHNDLPAHLNDRMKELFLDIEQWLGKSIERDLHERE